MIIMIGSVLFKKYMDVHDKKQNSHYSQEAELKNQSHAKHF